MAIEILGCKNTLLEKYIFNNLIILNNITFNNNSIKEIIHYINKIIIYNGISII